MTDIVERLRDLADPNKPHEIGDLWNGLDEAAAEIERLRGPVAKDHQQCIDYWGHRTEKAEAEIERLRAALEDVANADTILEARGFAHHTLINDISTLAPVFVPHRPVWLDVNGLPDADWHQQRLLSVTQGTLELARQAMQIRNEEFVNHLYARAISEINQVISSEEPKP